MADFNFYLHPDYASKFNDTNGDNLGEFEGWGTSLCWWANRLGYNKNLIDQAVEKFYSEKGLNLNIGRYNVGGGDYVKQAYRTPFVISRDNKKIIYDVTTSGKKPEFFGTDMVVQPVLDFINTTYSASDSDFGITKGSIVGEVNVVNYINKLGDPTTNVGNLTYSNINVDSSGRYTVKFLLHNKGTNTTDFAIKVNDTTIYHVNTNDINNNIIATGNNHNMYVVTFDNVYLMAGINKIEVGSYTREWCLEVLKMCIVRSRDDKYYQPWATLPPNRQSYVFDIDNIYYNGSHMEINPIGDDLQSSGYKWTDYDIGVDKDNRIGYLEAINYVNKLDDDVTWGSNIRCEFQCAEAGDYRIKLIMYYDCDELDRDIAIRVNRVKYHITKDMINHSLIGESGTKKLYLITIGELSLRKGRNVITIGGDTTDWTLDFVKMMVIKNSSEQNTHFLHNSHITRSDSTVPGYCVDVTKIDTNKHDIEWYNEYFERVDEECGYAWNYNWDADKYQMNITKAIAKYRGSDFIAEAFSNSPPYFMTESGCSSGAHDSSDNNLRHNSHNAFAKYMADVIAHVNSNSSDYGFKFTSATGMNEPYTNYWGANSNKQEGCHFDQGYEQSRVIKALNWNLKDRGVEDCIICGTDETSINIAIDSYNALDSDAKQTISRIDTHTYDGWKRNELRELAEREGKNLWMSEVDGDFTAGTDAQEMSAALGLANRIIQDVGEMRPSAWILWDIVDMHTDTGNVYDGNDTNWLNTWSGYWGLTIGNHDDEDIVCLKKYYAFGQFTRYIRPGYCVFYVSDKCVGAYDPIGNKVVLVAINTNNTNKSAEFSFDLFKTMNTTKIEAIRTSGNLSNGENWKDVSSSCNISINNSDKKFTATLKANSITTFIVNGITLK